MLILAWCWKGKKGAKLHGPLCRTLHTSLGLTKDTGWLGIAASLLTKVTYWKQRWASPEPDWQSALRALLKSRVHAQSLCLKASGVPYLRMAVVSAWRSGHQAWCCCTVGWGQDWASKNSCLSFCSSVWTWKTQSSIFSLLYELARILPSWLTRH